MMDARNLLDMFEEIANSKPQALVALCADDKLNTEKMTYEKLQYSAKALACYLLEHYQPGDRLLVMTSHGLEYYIALFGCFYAGLTVVPMAPPNPANLEFELSQIQKIFISSGAKCLLTTKNIQHYLDIVGNRPTRTFSIKSIITKAIIKARVKKAFKHFGMDKIKPIKIIDELPPVLYIEDLIKNPSSSWKKPLITDNTLAFILYTSGSTGTPKGVMITQKSLAYNTQMMINHVGIKENDAICCWLPITTIAGIMGRLIGAITGKPTLVFSALQFIQNPLLWLHCISKYKLTVSLAPCFAYTLCCRVATEEKLKHLDLSCLRIAVSGGEMIRRETLEEFNQIFSPYGFKFKSFYPYYGLTETLCTTTTTNGSPFYCIISGQSVRDGIVSHELATDNDAVTLVSNGTPLKSTTVKIVDPNKLTLQEPNQIGEIWVKSISNTLGYWNNPELTQATTHNYTTDTQEGPFFRTGDLGFIEDDQLYITGRLKELIIIHGKNYYPEYIEDILTQQLNGQGIAINACAAFAVEVFNEEGLALIVELNKEKTLEEKKELSLTVRKILTHFLGIRIEDIAYTHAPLPRTRTNKIMRLLCKNNYENGLFGPTIEGLNKSSAASSERFIFPKNKPENAVEIERNLTQWISTNGNIKKVNSTDSLNGYNFDSINSVSLIAELSGWLSFPISPSILQREFTIETLSHYLKDELEAHQLGKSTGISAEFLDLEQEVAYTETISNKAQPSTSQSPSTIFLTGVTGFLGAYLLVDLLAQTKAVIYCLVRADNEEEGLKRILNNLSFYKLSTNNTSRIKPVLGDLGQAHLGLSPEVLKQLEETIDVIYHSAALVNFVLPYQQLKPSNVDSLQDILSLAISHHAKPLHYVSTVAIFDSTQCSESSIIYETDTLPQGNTVYGGYSQSKWVAEQILAQAIEKGVSATVYRPGIITGDTITGAWRLGDAASRFIKSYLELGEIPVFNNSSVFDMVPVDYVSKAIVTLSLRDKPRAQVYHVTNPQPISVPELIEISNTTGYEVIGTPYDAFIKKLQGLIQNDSTHILYPLLPLFLERISPEQTVLEAQIQRPYFDCANTLEHLAETSINCTPANKLYEFYLSYFAAEHWVEPNKRGSI